MVRTVALVSLITAGGLAAGCGVSTQAATPEALQRQYGVNGAYLAPIPTGEGTLQSTVVPVTLSDGREGQLVIPVNQRGEPHRLYLRDTEGLHPVYMDDHVNRAQFVQSPTIVRRRVEPVHRSRHSWERDALIVGGGAGGGALIGALAGGKKGAAIGAATGGIGGLIYDLATR
jgi:hypothetical protein